MPYHVKTPGKLEVGDVYWKGDNINDSAGHGQGYFYDVNSDGVVDIVVFGETMRNDFNNYDGSIEIYLGNFNLELKN